MDSVEGKILPFRIGVLCESCVGSRNAPRGIDCKGFQEWIYQRPRVCISVNAGFFGIMRAGDVPQAIWCPDARTPTREVVLAGFRIGARCLNPLALVCPRPELTPRRIPGRL